MRLGENKCRRREMDAIFYMHACTQVDFRTQEGRRKWDRMVGSVTKVRHARF